MRRTRINWGYNCYLDFGYIFITSIKIARRVDNLYLKFLSIGIGLSLFTQVFINIGVVIGLMPVTGITLPVLSYGGSSLVLTLSFLGILINISKYTDVG